MAYGIGGSGKQWGGTINSADELAAVIQGESSQPDGQFAVAATMYNRLLNGSWGASISDVVTPSQFNGYNTNVSPQAKQLANDLWSGQAPQGGDPGNALYFAAPRQNNAAWANPNTASGQGLFSYGANIAGNYFTDRSGPPSSNFRSPVFNWGGSSAIDPGVSQDNVDAYTPSLVGQGGNPTPGAAAPYTNAPIAPNFGSLNQGADTSSIGNPSFADPTSNFGNSTPINPNYYSTPTITGGGGGNPDGGSSGGGGASGDWSSNPAYVLPQNGVDPSLGVANWADPTQNATATPAEPAVPTAQGAAKTISGLWNAQGATAVSTAGGEQAQATASAGNAVSKAINGAINKLSGAVGQSAQLTSKANTANVQGAEATGSGWLNAIFDNTRNLFQRGLIGFMGLILLLGAAMYFSRANQGA